MSNMSVDYFDSYQKCRNLQIRIDTAKEETYDRTELLHEVLQAVVRVLKSSVPSQKCGSRYSEEGVFLSPECRIENLRKATAKCLLIEPEALMGEELFLQLDTTNVK